MKHGLKIKIGAIPDEEFSVHLPDGTDITSMLGVTELRVTARSRESTKVEMTLEYCDVEADVQAEHLRVRWDPVVGTLSALDPQ